MIPMRIYILSIFSVLMLQAAISTADVPPALKAYFKKDVVVKGEAIAVIPPKEFDLYVGKVEEAAKKNTEWFNEYSKDAPAGVPLPYHENLGLTKDEYDAYIKAWNAREFKNIENVQLRLEEDNGEWVIRATGKRGAPISLLRYKPDGDVFKSPNGELKRIADIDADSASILGGWTGKEWKYSKESDFVSMKENLAVGRTKDGKYGMIVYRIQEVTPQGRRIYDKSAVIRFALR